MVLTFCTLTGLDEKTPLNEIDSLSRQFPIVEWGFLYSPKRQGHPGRYPSVEFLRNAFKELPAHVKVALHVCGAGVPQLIDAEPVVSELVQLVGQRGGRVQLNFNARTTEDKFTVAQIHACIARHPDVQFITQHNGANANVWLPLKDLPNHAVLFDASGGKGISADQWLPPLDGMRCGYAGGLGPDNVSAELTKIRAVAGTAPFWIDMEGKLRDSDDWFDLGVSKAVLQAVTGSFLSVEQLALKAELVSAKAILDSAELQYRRLKANCNHLYQPVSESAVCLVCNDRGGWWCPGSSNGLCEYGPNDPCNDWCIHCGEPEERK